MGFTDFDASVQHRFGLDLDGSIPISIMEFKGLKLEQDVVELPVNTPTGEFMTKKLPGPKKAPEFTLVRPADGDKTFSDWIKASRKGDMATARKSGAIIEKDYMLGETRRWNFQKAWPKSHEYSDMKAGSTEPRTETVVIVCEEIEEA